MSWSSAISSHLAKNMATIQITTDPLKSTQTTTPAVAPTPAPKPEPVASTFKLPEDIGGAPQTGQFPSLTQAGQSPAPAPAPVASPGASQPKPYTVEAGDTLSSIAQKFGVLPSQISGYRSGDPNKIFPGETLSVGSAVAAPAAPKPTVPTTPSGLTEEQALAMQRGTVDTDLFGDSSVFKAFGIDPASLTAGFNTNPAKTIKDLATEVMNATGLPDISKNLTDIASQVEELENERDTEIEKINDNPFASFGTKQERIKQVTERYERKITNRTNKLKLLQGAYDDARQQAQFVATTAIGLYDRNRNFDQNKLEFFIQQAEKALEAEKGLEKGFTLSSGQTRYEINPATGQYEPVAAAPKSSSVADTDDIDTYAAEYNNKRITATNIPKEIRGDVLTRAKELLVSSLEDDIKQGAEAAVSQEDLLGLLTTTYPEFKEAEIKEKISQAYPEAAEEAEDTGFFNSVYNFFFK